MRLIVRRLGLFAFFALMGLLLAAPVRADETLTYDANGNVATRTLPGGTTNYGYDDLDRLTSEAGPAKSQTIGYDGNGNRLSDAAGAKTYTPNSDRLAAINGVAVNLDAGGNITQAHGRSFAWNQGGQLKSVSRGTTLLATYYYDYKGRRSRKVMTGYGSLSYRTSIYVYDIKDRLTAELDGAGRPRLTYVWRDDLPVAIIGHGYVDDVVLYLETDHLGTPIAARDQVGTVVWRWEPDAFGAVQPQEDPDGDGQATTINLRFPGQYYDAESGLHYNWHRYYDPMIGRYLSPDPIGLDGGTNLYSYVGGKPLNLADPEGLQAAQAVTLIVENWKPISTAVTAAISLYKLNEASEAAKKAIDEYKQAQQAYDACIHRQATGTNCSCAAEKKQLDDAYRKNVGAALETGKAVQDVLPDKVPVGNGEVARPWPR